MLGEILDCLSLVDGILSTISLAEGMIRLLHICPKMHDSDRLMCSLDTFRLEEAPSYIAISYTWGRESADRVITLNDQLVKVTQNLYQILEYLSNRDAGPIWIDSLCIDQSNLQEKSRQVQLLGKIYASSRATLVDLQGLIDERTNYQFARKSFAKQTSENSSFREELAALEQLELLSSPWFRRVWTLQEILLSRDIIFILKSEELGWDDFWAGIFSAYKHLEYLPTYALDSIAHAFRLNLIARSSKHWRQIPGCSVAVQQLRNILLHQSTLDSTDPRDKVYSLYGVLTLFDIKLPAPEYSKSVDQVFQEAAMSVQTMITATTDTGGMNSTDRLPAGYHGRWATHDNNGYHQELVNAFVKTLTVTLSYRSVSTFPDDAFSNAGHMAFNSYCAAASTCTLYDKGVNFVPEDLASGHSVLFDRLVGGLRKILSYKVSTYLKNFAGQERLMTCNDGDSSNSTGEIGSKKSSGIVGESPRGGTKGTSSKDKADKFRKRPVEEEDEEDFDRRPPKQSKDQVDIWDRLACPYFQRNSQGPRILGSCRGLGFENISRLKEHLYRDHLIYPCARCGAVSRKQDDLEKHLRQPESCAVTNWKSTFDRAQGFDDQQERDIRRKTIRSWQAVFKILFPEDGEQTYPPQYHRNPQFVRLFDQFEAHYHEQIQRLIPERLSNVEFLARFPLEEQYGVQLAITNTVSEIHLEVVGSFRNNILRASQGTEFSDPNRLFLDYLDHVAPEGALPDNFLAAEVADSDLSGLFPSIALPYGNSSPTSFAEETWHMVDQE